MTEVVTLEIEGMTCSCEAELVESKLSALAGVQALDVDAISRRARVSFDPSLVTVQDIVLRAGLSADESAGVIVGCERPEAETVKPVQECTGLLA